jgi:hypothetical protein
MPEPRPVPGRIDPSQVIGWGVDADPENDPTYPMRQDAHPAHGLDWERPAIQPETVEILRSTEHNRRPAVYGTSSPPSGISGSIRRQAFKSSEGKWSHWLLLLLADRINVVEGVGQDLARGHIPNIPGEMGIRSEIAHNMPGFVRKLAFAGAGVALTYALVSAARSRR